MPYIHHSSLRVPKPATALSFASFDSLTVGSDDGSVRSYSLPSTTVVRAIRGLGSAHTCEISSIVWTVPPAEDEGEVWVACGNKSYAFQLNQPSLRKKLILTAGDAASTFTAGEDDEQEINELCVNSSKQSLAFCNDEGSVCVFDLKSRTSAAMKMRHSNICSSVRFIPDRPNELVSGGYDSALLHFDYKQGTLLSRYDVVAPPPEAGTMAMPFVISLAMSPTGVVAANLADGRVWISAGGAKLPAGQNKGKRSRKWEGLRDSMSCYKRIATGPVIASVFTSDGDTLLTCTLLGKLAQHRVVFDGSKLDLELVWSDEVKSLQKVSAIAASEKWFAIAGFEGDEKGTVEIWCPSPDVGDVPSASDLTTQIEQLSVSNTQA